MGDFYQAGDTNPLVWRYVDIQYQRTWRSDKVDQPPSATGPTIWMSRFQHSPKLQITAMSHLLKY